MNSTIKNLQKNLFIIILLAMQSSLLFADDIAIFESEKPAVPPNIMFVIDGSGSMDWAGDAAGNSRMAVLQSAMGRLLSNQTDDINVGVMSFSNNLDGDWRWLVHGPAYPIRPIDSAAESVPSNSYLPQVNANETTRAYTQRVINDWVPGSGTPIVGALFEAAKYMRGENVHWGNKPADESQSAHPSSYTGTVDGSTTTVITNVSEPCGGTTGVTCNRRATCTPNPPITSTPVISETPIAGQDCVELAPTTKACAVGETFCGTATAATECTSVTTPSPTEEVTCALENATVCKDSDPLIVSCSQGAPILCQKKLTPDAIAVTCPVKQYSCTTTTPPATAESCTHIISGSITSSSAKYISPITEECQSNAIILMSDGVPTVNDTSALITSMIGADNAKKCDEVPRPLLSQLTNGWNSDASIDYYGRCGEELAAFLLKSDNGSVPKGKQTINLYTVGFNLTATSNGGRYLEKLAKAGGGQSFFADNEEELMNAFEEAITNSNRARLFSPPTYTANSDTLLAHGDVVYLPVFNRESNAVWNGNLKKFKMKDGDLVEGVGSPPYKKVKDNTGKMRADVVDMWALGGASDNAVTGGGAASRLDPSSRKIVTDSGVDDKDPLVKLDASNVTNVQLGAADNNEKAALIKYITGWTDDDKPRKHMGDIIHSKPVYVDYPGGRRVIFVGTNEGFLHAINDSDGTEAFAFMPEELLKNIKKQKDNADSSDHIYGVDGEITVWQGKLEPTDTDEKTLLVFGLRRGGKAYYVLDVTDPDNPKLHWKVVHAPGGKLGFSWAKAKIAKVRDTKLNGTTKNVVIFSGGYVDDNGTLNGVTEPDKNPSGTGAAIFILDLKDGTKLVGSSGTANNALEYAIPGGVRVVDFDNNGFMDHLYFADTGGFVWRMDINTLEDIKLYKLANLAGTPKRKFFNEPDIAIFKHGGRFVVSIAIGSGERPSPLDKSSEDAFFVLIDKHPMFYSTSDQFDTSNDTIEIDDLLQMDASKLSTGLEKGLFHKDNKDKKGWYYALAKGEKILTSAYTFENKIVFTSFSANELTSSTTTSTENVCNTETNNISQLYVLDMYSGKSQIKPVNDPLPRTAGIMEPPMPYYAEVSSASCVGNQQCRTPVIPSIGGGNPIPLATPNMPEPRVYWMKQQ